MMCSRIDQGDTAVSEGNEYKYKENNHLPNISVGMKEVYMTTLEMIVLKEMPVLSCSLVIISYA
jgi:hypothetical protein